MRILFVLNTPGFLRYFDVTVDALLERGHDVTLAFVRPDLRPESLEIYDTRPLRPAVADRFATRDDAYAPFAAAVRAAVDYVRYLDPRYARAEYLRNRRRLRAFAAVPTLRVLGLRSSLPRPLPGLLERFFLALERRIPSSPTIEAFLRRLAPDVVLVSPLVTGASPQTDYVKSARALGVPSALCVASWDNLTNKGLMRELPDRVVVWNDVQRREAVELHGGRDAAVVVTGAQPFDRWFGREPSCSREEFCGKVGLPADRPFVMFVGSTSNIAQAGVEEDFVRRWIEALRDRGEQLGVLVRPHPDRPGAWEALDLEGLDDVSVWPPVRPNSVAVAARTDYFDSLYHSAAVVGINTSAMIEAAIIGRPVLTVRSPEFVEAQDGTIHFQYLLPENGGFVRAAPDLEAHVDQLVEAVADPEPLRADRDRFVESFIRPRGRDRASNDVLVEAIEAMAEVQPRPYAPPHGVLAAAVRFAVGWAGRRRSRLERATERRGRRARAVGAAVTRLERQAPPLVPVVRGAGRLLDAYERHRVTRLKQQHRRQQAARKAARDSGKERGRKLLAPELE